MKKYKLGALLLSVSMLGSVVMTGCSNTEETTAETTTAQTEATTSAAETTPAETAGEYAPEYPDANGAPALYEDFGVDPMMFVNRGDSITTEMVDAAEAGNVACKISGRTDAWNGINFPADVFVGNTIRIQTNCKCDGGTVRVSVQYDTAGSTTYSNVFDIVGCSSDYVCGVGTFTIPEHVTNCYVYVEGVDTTDIYVDYMYATVEGEYVEPEGAITELVDTSDYVNLSEVYADYFKLGCAIPNSLVTNEYQEFITLVGQEFNSITLENELKPDSVLDAEACLADPEKYNECPAVHFDNAKDALDWAQANDIKVRGHVLIWHSQTPDWFFYENYDNTGNLASRELMLTRMENYIKEVLTYMNDNYPGLFYAYDVVNEAIDDEYNLRESFWTQTIGDDFIEKAFEFARKYAGEGVDLFYNDYNEYVEGKQAKIIETLKPVAEAGNIDGFGMQSHINISITPEEYVAVMQKYVDELGVKIHITELDIKQSTVSFNAEYDQGVFYNELFSALVEAKKNGMPLESVTFWGLTDDMSWRANEHPLLFNGDLSIKDSFRGVLYAVTGEVLEKPADYREPLGPDDAIDENYEGDTYYGNTRISSTLTIVTDDPYEGNACLMNSEGSAEYDGYSFDVSRFCGTTIKYSFAIKSPCKEVHFVADIEGSWPWIENIDTSSGEWILVEGTYEIPSDLTYLSLYLETPDMTEFYIDALHIEVAA
ncbi:MAG: endo-1,4-beta-xylanase [Clostridia bacterium]|nr:endo-1,4-beta-xylanase [Clostridia bacterium]